jgi:hypothetical protein
MKIKTHKLKREDVYKGEVLISRHYWISDKIQIELIRISSKQGGNLSLHVRNALKDYIEKNQTEKI